MSRYDRVERTVPWIIVMVFLSGAVLVAFGITTGGLVLAIVGAVTVVVAGLGGVVLPRVGLSAPLSFNANFPETAGTSGSPGTEQGSKAEQDATKVPEAPARRLPEGPDRERAKPQYVNLGPHEHLRSVGGEEVIEVPEDERRD